MKLVVVTQQVDPADSVLGATVAKLRALAERVDELVVLTDSASEGALPDNVRIRTFGAHRRAGRGLRFETALTHELARRPRPSAVLAHMCPIYAVLAAPLARPTGVKVLLWFTHWRRSRLLSTATRLSTTVLSVDERTFPLRTRKLVAIGHGIDVSDLPCVKRPEDREPFTLLALGRTSAAKGLVTIVRAVEQVDEVRLRIVGPDGRGCLRARFRAARVRVDAQLRQVARNVRRQRRVRRGRQHHGEMGVKRERLVRIDRSAQRHGMTEDGEIELLQLVAPFPARILEMDSVELHDPRRVVENERADARIADRNVNRQRDGVRQRTARIVGIVFDPLLDPIDFTLVEQHNRHITSVHYSDLD